MSHQENFFQYPFYWNDAPVDLSFLYEDEKPAGKFGFIKCEGEKFLFENGREAKFWGTNFNSGACFPSHDKSELIAKRLAKFGVNIVRFHQMDAHWANPNIFQFSKGKRLQNTQTLDPESLDCLDYLIYCLKKEGIYTYMDLLTYRRVMTEDGMENTFNIIDGCKSISYFNRRMIELQKKFNEDLFTHYNPYTKLAYKDDPAIAMCEITNEDDLFAREVNIEPYYSELLEKYKAWCGEKGLTVEEGHIRFRADFSRQVTDFMMQVQVEYYTEMRDHLRSIGAKLPVAGTNWNIGVHNRCTQLCMDFCDNHQYYVSWEWEEHRKGFLGKHMLSEYDPFIGPMGLSRSYRKPFFVSEWDVPWPNHYRAESSIYLAACSAFQGWMGCAIHTYRYGTHTDNLNILGKEISSSAIGNVPYREGMFNTFNDPAKFGMFYAAALMFRRGDIRQAKTAVEVELHDEDMQLNMHDKLFYMPSMYGISEKHRVAVKMPIEEDIKGDRVIEKEVVLVPEKMGEVLSDTGEMYRSWERGYGWIDTDRTKAVYGFINKQGEVGLKGLSVSCENEFATIVLSSLSDEAMDETKNILITAVGRAENTGMEFNDEGNVMLEFGKAPILTEKINAQIKLTTKHSNMKVWSVNAEGFLTGLVPFRYEDGVLTIELGKTWPSIYYLIQAE